MATAQRVKIDDLQIDLHNFRTVVQKDEASALRTMIAIAPEKFWGLMDSLLEDGYLPNENIIVLKAKKTGELTVKEGNRRAGCLKLIHKLVPDFDVELPPHIQALIAGKDSKWLAENRTVPCVVYTAQEEATVDRIVSLTHGKGQKAGRDRWEAIARARHSRDKEGKSEPGLDLFEKYLQHAKNVTADQADRWSGSYPLTILDEALKKTAARFGVKTSRELADGYPKTKKVKILDDIIRDIGLELFGFNDIRTTSFDFFTQRYGLADPLAGNSGGGAGVPPAGGGGAGGAGAPPAGGGAGGAGAPLAGGGAGGAGTPPAGGGAGGAGGAPPGGANNPGGRGKAKAAAGNDPKSVKQVLARFAPRGPEHQKLATLTKELKTLNLENAPHAFCFVLRSMFEIAAKQFASAHGISTTKSGGQQKTGKTCGQCGAVLPSTPSAAKDKTLMELLREASSTLTHGKPTMDPLVKRLHGALQELGKPHGILSVTSLNQLVHNTKFSATAADISIVLA